MPFTQLEFSSINTPTFNVTSLTLGRDIIFACGLQQMLNRSPGNILKIENFISGNRKWYKILTDWSKTWKITKFPWYVILGWGPNALSGGIQQSYPLKMFIRFQNIKEKHERIEKNSEIPRCYWKKRDSCKKTPKNREMDILKLLMFVFSCFCIDEMIINNVELTIWWHLTDITLIIHENSQRWAKLGKIGLKPLFSLIFAKIWTLKLSIVRPKVNELSIFQNKMFKHLLYI